MVSYGVVVYKSFPNVQFTLEFARRVFSEENVQYFLMAIFWWRSTPMLAPLVPYAVFAFFNSLNFMRGNLIPVLVPEPPAGTTDALYAKIQELSQSLQVWTQVNHTGAMAFVAYIEVVGVMGSLIFGAITFQSSFLSPIVYANFLRFRYYYSIHTRTAFALIRARLDNLILPPNGNASIPPAVARGYTLVRDTIIRYGEAPIQQSGGDRDHDRGRPQAR
ncbi:hypothetical protein BGX31_005790 [Mortierella sp. GBA43]|nr:hypothetical protein BGX31_005790 [Mortierella sp. GBA43]